MRTKLAAVLALLALAGAAPAVSQAQAKPPPTPPTQTGPTLGVNWWDLFEWHYLHPTDQSYITGMQQLAAHNITDVRFFASLIPDTGGMGATPIDLYYQNPQKFWKAMDDIFRQAQHYGIKLIPCMSWKYEYAAYYGAPASDQADPSTQSAALMRQDVATLVQRYRSSSALLMWEIDTEPNLDADTGQWPNLTAAQLHEILMEKGDTVRQYDTTHSISSGASIDWPSPAIWSYSSTDNNSPVGSPQWQQTELEFNPFNVLSAHIYEQSDLYPLSSLVSLGQSLREPVIVGEFGIDPSDQNQPALYQQLLDGLKSSGVSIALLWTFNTLAIDNWIWSATYSNSLAFELQAL